MKSFYRYYLAFLRDSLRGFLGALCGKLILTVP